MSKIQYFERKLKHILNVVIFFRWTPLPGVCMRNGIVVNNMPLKVTWQLQYCIVNIQKSTIAGSYHLYEF